jgi:hypothetical protein
MKFIVHVSDEQVDVLPVEPPIADEEDECKRTSGTEPQTWRSWSYDNFIFFKDTSLLIGPYIATFALLANAWVLGWTTSYSRLRETEKVLMEASRTSIEDSSRTKKTRHAIEASWAVAPVNCRHAT